MTDTTKRLAEDLYGAFRGKEFMPYAWKALSNNQRDQWRAVAATAMELTCTAAQEANVQGGEALARRFHEIYELLAPSFGYETRKETRAFDPTTPNGKLMIAVCNEIAVPPGVITQLEEDVVLDGIPMKKGYTVLLKNTTTPAPASGEVFNILLGMRARLASYRDDGSVTREAGFWLMQEIGTALTIEAATRARQGEGGT